MTTSISSAEISSPGEANIETSDRKTEVSIPKPVEPPVYRVPHTLASRFIFLNLCVVIVFSALAFGTVHSWALILFSLGALVTVVLWVVDAWSLGKLRISRNPLQIPLLGMLALGLIQLLPLGEAPASGALTAPASRSLSFDPYSTRMVLAQVATLLIFFAATLVFTDSPHRLRLLVRTIIIFGFFMAIFGLTQSFVSPTRVYWFRELAQSTAFGPFINRHHFAGYMELTLGLPLGLLFAGSLEKEKRFVYLFAALLMGLALIMTNSRGGIISVVAEILFLVALTMFRKRKKRGTEDAAQRIRRAALRSSLALVLIVGLFAGVVWLGGESVLSRFVGTVNSDDPTTGRAHFWTVTTDIIKAHPFLGTGLGAFAVVYTRYDSRNGLYRLEQAHNDYLQVLSDGGIVGAVLGLLFIVILFRMGFDRRESRDEFRSGVAIGALAGCFAVLVHSFFDFTLHTTSNALLFLVLAGIATINGRVEQPTAPRRRRRSHRGKAEPVLIKSEPSHAVGS